MSTTKAHFTGRAMPILARWKTWWHGSINRRIFAAAVAVAIFTFIAKFFSVAKDLVVAYQFGVSDAVDAYLIAFMLPAFTISIIAGSFGPAFIPTYLRLWQQSDRVAAQRLVSSMMIIGVGFLALICFVLVAIGPALLSLLAAGFSQEKLALTQSLFLMLLPTLVVSGTSAIAGAVLNAHERFSITAMTPMLSPLCGIVALLFGGHAWGIYALAAGTVVGLVTEMAVLLTRFRGLGLDVFRWRGVGPDVRGVLRQYVATIAGALLMGSTELVDQTMAAALGSGSVAALAYGNKVVIFVLGVSSVALSTAVLPHFSRMVVERDWRAIRHTLRVYRRLILAVTVPMVILLVWWSDALVRILFERGAFGETDARLVSEVQVYFLLQIPFYLLGIMGVRLVSALSLNHVLVVIALVNFVANIIGNLLLSKLFGVAGIALSTTIVYFLSFSLIYWYLSGVIRTGIATDNRIHSQPVA